MKNPVYGKAEIRAGNLKQNNVGFWVLICILIGFIAWAPFQTALFNGQMLEFEKPIYWAISITAILFGLANLLFYKKNKFEEQSDLLSFAVFLLPISYLISLPTAASHYLATNMVLIQFLYAFMFIIGLWLLKDKLANKIIQIALMSISYLIILFGFLNWFGQYKLAANLIAWFSNAVLNGKYTHAVMPTADGLRLTSVFQYANTYAAFLMAILFAIIFCIIRSNRWYVQLIHSFMLVPTVVSLTLTLSRGGLILLPVVFVLLLLFIRPARQVLWFLYCAIAGIFSLTILGPMISIGNEIYESYNPSNAVKGWFYLIAVSILVATIILLIQRFLSGRLENALRKLSARKFATLWIPLFSIVLGGLLIVILIGTSFKNLLPENLSTRLDNINFSQNSVLERLTFYKDTIKVLSDYPIIGAGGGAWASLYEQYQNNPYTSRQAHNFFLQYLIEVGIIGFVIFISFIIIIFYKYLKGYIKASEEERDSHFLYFILVLSVLIHSILDFNMSYVFIGLLVFLGLGGMASSMENLPVKMKAFTPAFIKTLFTILAGLTAIFVMIFSIKYIQANHYALEARKIAQTSQSFEEIKEPLDKDLSIRSSHPDSVLLLSALYHSVYKQTQDIGFYNLSVELLNKAHKDEPYNKLIINRMIQGYELNGEKDKAFNLLVDNAFKFKWDIEWHERIINQAFDLGSQALGINDMSTKDKYFKQGTETFEEVQAGTKHLATLPVGQLQGRPFENKPDMILNAGKMYFMTNQPDNAAAALKIGLQDDMSDPVNQDIATWYLASLKKLGQDDPTFLAKLIEVNPNAEQQIKELAEVGF